MRRARVFSHPPGWRLIEGVISPCCVFFQLQQRKIQNELCCLDLRTKIKALWERLQTPQEEREALSHHMVESKKRNMEAVRNLPQFGYL